MPWFYFNLFDDIASIDEEGRDLSSADEAHSEAVKSAREMACAEVDKGHLHLHHRIDVVDSTGELIERVWFRDVVRVED
jgi:hypothetical protein